MTRAKHKSLVEKSVQASIAAIEIYNKPYFKYREETFSILMINAWELLLKAKILRDNNNDLRSIYEMVHKVGKNNNKLRTKTPKLNYAGNPITIGISKCLSICESPLINLNPICKENIELLIQIRDAAIHFQNGDLLLSKKVYEIGTAALRNYLTLINDWFSYDLSAYNFYLMPISFYHEFDVVKSFSINPQREQIENLLRFMAEKETEFNTEEIKDYNISLQIETKFVKSSSTEALLVKYSKDDDALKIQLTDSDFFNRWPIEFNKLKEKCKNRYIDFKMDKEFYDKKSELEKNLKYSSIRKLDPNNPISPKKTWYSLEVFKEFDKIYTIKDVSINNNIFIE